MYVLYENHLFLSLLKLNFLDKRLLESMKNKIILEV